MLVLVDLWVCYDSTIRLTSFKSVGAGRRMSPRTSFHDALWMIICSRRVCWRGYWYMAHGLLSRGLGHGSAFSGKGHRGGIARDARRERTPGRFASKAETLSSHTGFAGDERTTKIIGTVSTVPVVAAQFLVANRRSEEDP